MSFDSGLVVARVSPNNRLVRDALRRAPRATTGTLGPTRRSRMVKMEANVSCTQG
jgi:hypothetical protein